MNPPAPITPVEELLNVLDDIANMPEYDQDDAHRLRYKAAQALKRYCGPVEDETPELPLTAK